MYVCAYIINVSGSAKRALFGCLHKPQYGLKCDFV